MRQAGRYLPEYWATRLTLALRHPCDAGSAREYGNVSGLRPSMRSMASPVHAEHGFAMTPE